jgi:hypothetical protein
MEPAEQGPAVAAAEGWSLIPSRLPTEETPHAISKEDASQLFLLQQTRIAQLASTLIEDSVLERAIQAWREDLLTDRKLLRPILQKHLRHCLPRLPVLEKAAACELELLKRRLTATQTAGIVLQILLPTILIAIPFYTFYTSDLFRWVGSTLSTSSSACPNGFLAVPRIPPILSLYPESAAKEVVCREQRCTNGTALRNGTCVPMHCSSLTQRYDDSWGFCVEKERRISGLLWGSSLCEQMLSVTSVFQINCWISYGKMLLQWISQIPFTQIVFYGCSSFVYLLFLLSSIRTSTTSFHSMFVVQEEIQRLKTFSSTMTSIALERLESHCMEAILPSLFTHLDRFACMNPTTRAISIAEYGFVYVLKKESDPTLLLQPLFIKCIQDTLVHFDSRSILLLVEGELVESSQFHSLSQWIEDSSREFRDEIGRLRAQSTLKSFQEEFQNAVRSFRATVPQKKKE